MKRRIAIVGGGISGAVLARCLADYGIGSTVCESNATLGGMCREITWNGSLVSEFGPHIFRTSNTAVWKFISRFCRFVEASHNVETFVSGKSVPFPPLTGNPPETLSTEHKSIGDYLVAAVGEDVFSRYYETYTTKRWGVSAFELSPDMIPLIPVWRHSSGFFSESRVGIPASGYTQMIENILDHALINVHLSSPVQVADLSLFNKVVWTGRLDRAFPDADLDCEYRAVTQTFSNRGEWPAMSSSVINYPGTDVSFIRKTNYQLLLPWRPPVIGTEFASDDGYPAYPVRTNSAVANINAHLVLLRSECPNLIPHGRLGLFRYASMDQSVENSLALADRIINKLL